MKRTTEWTCDVCEEKATVVSTEHDSGTDLPNRWQQAALRISKYEDKGYDWNYVKHIVMCYNCFERFKAIYYLEPKTKEFVKLPFWKRLLGAK